MTEATNSPDSPDASVFDTIDPADKIVTAELTINAAAAEIFELIADPSRQPEWDGHDNLASAGAGQRVQGVDQSFITMLTKGVERENHIVEFDESRLIAWKPSEVGGEAFGQKWAWELEPVGENTTRVRHTYDWTELTDVSRLPRARSITSTSLLASMERLKALAEG